MVETMGQAKEARDVKVLVVKTVKIMKGRSVDYTWGMVSLGAKTLKLANLEVGDKVYQIVFEEGGDRHILISKKPPDWLIKPMSPTE